jgi:hypothetical protein
MSHIWEAETMMHPELWQSKMLDSIRNGECAGVSQGISAFTGAGGDFENTPTNKVRAFIITPYQRGNTNPGYNDLEYPVAVDKIKKMLTNTLGRSDILNIPYFATGPDDQNETPYGKALIQYDPDAASLVSANGGCSQQLAGIELL